MDQRQPQHTHGPDDVRPGGAAAGAPTDTPRTPPRKSSPGADTSSWYRMAGVGFEFIVAVGLFGALGWWLDRVLGTRPWLLIAGFGLGFAVGLFQMVRAANRMFKD